MFDDTPTAEVVRIYLTECAHPDRPMLEELRRRADNGDTDAQAFFDANP